MKDFKVGDNVFVLKKEYISNILNGKIIKIYPNSNRFKVRYDFSKLFSLDAEERIVERFQDDDEVFNTYEEAYREAMNSFNKKVEYIENHRQRFIEEVRKDIEKGKLIKTNDALVSNSEVEKDE